MGSATPIDRENIPMSRASLALGEDSSVCGLGEDRQTDRHPSPAQEETGSTSERKPASRTNCAPALGPPGQTDSRSPGLVQSPKQGTAAWHIPANPAPVFTPAAKATDSQRPHASLCSTVANLPLLQKSPFSSSYGSRVWKITVEVPAPRATAALQGRMPVPLRCAEGQYQGSARCCWL